MENLKNEIKFIENAITIGSGDIFKSLEDFFITSSIEFIKSRKQKFIAVLKIYVENEKLTGEEAQQLEEIILSKEDFLSAFIDYESFIESLANKKRKHPLDKIVTFVLLPFLVIDSVEDILKIKKTDVKFIKTKRNMLIMFINSPQGEYIVHIHRHIKLYEKFYKEFLLRSLGVGSKNNDYIFGSEDVRYSHNTRVLREKIDTALTPFYSLRDRETNRTMISIVKEDIKKNPAQFYFSQL